MCTECNFQAILLISNHFICSLNLEEIPSQTIKKHIQCGKKVRDKVTYLTKCAELWLSRSGIKSCLGLSVCLLR